MFWKIWKVVRSFVYKCKQDNIRAYAAEAAFFVILSMIPFLMLFISMIKYTPITEGMILIVVERMAPKYLSPFLVGVIDEMYHKNVGLISVTAIVAVWASARGVQYLSDGLNAVYGIKETRNFFQVRIRAILYTIVFLVAVVLALLLLIFGNSLQQMIMEYIPLIGTLTGLIIRLRFIIMIAVFVLFFAILFKKLPNRRATIRSQLPGSLLCAGAWILFSYGLSLYIDYFNGFSMYGSLSTIVLLMLWLYFGVYIVLICGEINNTYENKMRMTKE